MAVEPRLTHREFERTYVRPRPGATLIVGSKVYETNADRRSAFQNCIGVDIQAGDGVDRVVDFEQPLPEDLGRFDHVECVSVLEHARRPWLVVQNMEQVLVEGGTMFVTVPFVWRVHSYPNDYWRFTMDGLMSLFTQIKWQTVVYGDREIHTGKIKSVTHDNHPYMARTEVLAFGIKQ